MKFQKTTPVTQHGKRPSPLPNPLLLLMVNPEQPEHHVCLEVHGTPVNL